METKIVINGQINGNHRLHNAICTSKSRTETAAFYGYRIYFKTKKEAKKALWDAYKYMRAEEPEYAKRGITYLPGEALYYDGSKAELYTD